MDLDASCTVVPDYLAINLDREAATLEPLQAVMALAEALVETVRRDGMGGIWLILSTRLGRA